MKGLLCVFIAPMMLLGCTYATTNYIRNDSGSEIEVTVRETRSDLGWDKRQRQSFGVPEGTTCTVSTDPYSENYLFIRTKEGDKNTNLSMIESSAYIYKISTHNGEQVVNIIEADRAIRKALEKSFQIKCVANEEVEN